MSLRDDAPVTAELRPTFLVIGAAKAGTTTVFRHLDAHPDVFASPVKEPRFFALEGAPPDHPGRFPDTVTEWDDYLRLYDGARPDQARGEASTLYLHAAGVIPRVQARIPDARLVAILRHPVDAVWSRYQMVRRLNRVTDSLEDLVSADPDEPASDLVPDHPGTYLVRSCRYHVHLARWWAAFPPEQLLVLLHEDLVDDPGGTMARIYRHIGVDPTLPAGLDLGARHNAGGSPRSAGLYRFLYRPGPVAQVAHRLGRRIPGGRRVRQAVERSNERPSLAMSAELRGVLLGRFRADDDALEAALDRDLGAWRR
ncbi:MAG: sulfotransferase [Acidimicrobiales bacterium]|nr:sulfotransferase [Acidimicrobiales bacterium]